MEFLTPDKIKDHDYLPNIPQEDNESLNENDSPPETPLNQIMNAQDTNDISSSDHKTTEEMEAKILSLQKEKQGLQDELDKYKQVNNTMKNSMKELESENSVLKMTLEELKKRNKELERENSRLFSEGEKMMALMSSESFSRTKNSLAETNLDSSASRRETGGGGEFFAFLNDDNYCKNRKTISPHLLENFEFRASCSSPFKKSQSMANAGEVAVFLRNKSISDNIMEQFSFSPAKNKKDLMDGSKLLDESYHTKPRNSNNSQREKFYIEGLAKSIVFGNVNPVMDESEVRYSGASSISSLKHATKKPVKLDCRDIRSRTLTIFKGLKFKPPKLFEDFLIMGIDRESILQYLLENPKVTKANLPAKILWNFKSEESLDGTPKQSLQDFVFPFGVKIKDVTDAKQENEKVAQKLYYDKGKLQSMKMAFPLLPWNNDILTGDWDPAVEQMNEHHLIYFVCIITNDYITLSQEDLLRIDPETPKGTRMYEVKTAFCFMTYYPIISFFYDLLKCTSNQLRHIRREGFMTNNRDFRGYDLDAWMKLSSEHLKKSLQIIYDQCPVPECGKKLEVALNNYPQYPLVSSFSIPPINEAFSVESLWGSYIVFSYLSLKDIRWLLSAILLEKKLIFLSKNMTLLSSTLSVLITLIKPFLYTYPIIFSVPEVLLGLCDAPGAGIMGINKGEDYFWSEDMINLYPSCVFIFLDSKKVYALEETKVAKMPVFSDFDMRLKQAYQEINNSVDEIKKFMTVDKILKMKMKDETQLEKVSRQNEASDSKKYFRSQVIFMLVRITWREKIINIIENELREKNHTFEKIAKEIVGQYFFGNNKDFLRDFAKSQILLYFYQTLSSKTR